MDISTIGGIVAGIAIMMWGILSAASLGDFVDVGSIIIVLGGTFTAIFISYPISTVLKIGKIFGIAAKNKDLGVFTIIKQIIDLANTARKDGLLALEAAVANVDDDFMKKGVMLIVDGTDPELVKSILETELAYIDDRHSKGKGIFDTLAALAPAYGMLGTLIGLVAMLNSLSDPSTLGPKMAVALITTFYGSVVANMFCIPIANKLSFKAAEESFVRQIVIEGLLSIQAGENPRLIEEKLKSFLSPDIRKVMEVGNDSK